MSRVLIWKNAAPGGEYDIFTPTSYSDLYDHVQKCWNGQSQNWGNKLWFQGIYSVIDNGENEYSFIPDEINTDEINSSYDFILLPMANIFHTEFVPAMRALTEIMEKIRIPVYVVVCGVQADGYDRIRDLIDAIGEPSKRFIRAIYNTGGDFALRGYFTKEFFERLGFSDATVTGCPSLYQMGPDFTVNCKRSAELSPVFNGQVSSVGSLMREFKNSVFIDQSEYFNVLYSPSYPVGAGLRFEMNFVRAYGKHAAELLGEGRIVMIADMNDWYGYLRSSGFNYSFGSRIHGTIMALLSGVPSTIVPMDSRTREMAEFFDIPMVKRSYGHKFTKEEFMVIYDEMNYDAFNRTFKSKFENYERFLISHGIVSHLNYENRFFTDTHNEEFLDAVIKNRSEFSELSKKLEKHMPIITMGNFARKIVSKLK